ncbi:hypothetical protein AB8B21_09820 [Tardiphaga sp. 866_E4_N2_1]|uniref:hypothetical protein n=1 Tax=unclassified Tardiphaga TaxID=2631404 RepID=UPI003F243010
MAEDRRLRTLEDLLRVVRTLAYEFSGAGPGQAAQLRPVEEDQPPAELLGQDVADRHAAPEAALAGIKVVEAWGG